MDTSNTFSKQNRDIMSIIITLLIFAVTSEAKLFLIEVKEKTSTNDSVLNSMNKGLSMLPKCSKEWVKACGQISGWNTKPKICGDKECIKNAEELHQVCKEQMIDGRGQSMMGKVDEEALKYGMVDMKEYVGKNTGKFTKEAVKACRKISLILKRCKKKNQKPKIWFKRRTKADIIKSGDYGH